MVSVMSKKPFGVEALRQAVDMLGGVPATAKALDRQHSAIWNIIGEQNRGIPRSWCQKIEKLTEGKITAHQLRPDLFA